jgi:hypothetical protein
VPYIYEDYVSHESVAKAFMTMFEMGPEKREELGKRAMEHAHKDYDLPTIVKRWDETMMETINTWRGKHKRWVKEEL